MQRGTLQKPDEENLPWTVDFPGHNGEMKFGVEPKYDRGAGKRLLPFKKKTLERRDSQVYLIARTWSVVILTSQNLIVSALLDPTWSVKFDLAASWRHSSAAPIRCQSCFLTITFWLTNLDSQFCKVRSQKYVNAGDVYTLHIDWLFLYCRKVPF